MPAIQLRGEALQMMFLERTLPTQGVEVLALESFHETVHAKLLPGGKPRMIQEGTLLTQGSGINSETPAAACVAHHVLDEKHRH